MTGQVTDADETLRVQIETLLATGMRTQSRERADSAAKVNRIIAELQGARRDDLETKLQVAGFTSTPYSAPGDDLPQSCATCMYYLVHRRHCALPELDLPVRPEWSCRLWRI